MNPSKLRTLEKAIKLITKRINDNKGIVFLLNPSALPEDKEGTVFVVLRTL